MFRTLCHSLIILALALVLACDAGDGSEGGPTDPSDSTDTSDSGSEPDSGPHSDTDGEDTGEALLLDLNLSDAADAKLVGEEPADADGRVSDSIAVASAGDVDADGFSDLLVGLGGSEGGGAVAGGAAYVVRGPVSGTVDLSLAHARLYGTIPGYAGMAVASAGDLDADGLDDILVGAPFLADGDRLEGRVYVFRGGVAGAKTLEDADTTLQGEYTFVGDGIFSETGASLAGGGDVDGDGHDDILVGAPIFAGMGAAYLLRGPLDDGELELSTDADVRMLGEGLLGSGVAFAGDVDGDGLDDVLVGNPFHDSDRVLLFLGPVDASSVAEADVVFVDGDDDDSGHGPRSAGDTNADGYADILVDAPSDDDGGESAGAAYLLLAPFAGRQEVGLADAKFVGSSEWGRAGSTVDGAGDVDGDGRADVLVGAPDERFEPGPGAACLLLSPSAGTRSISDADVIMRGDGDDRAGQSLASAGDVDGDGGPDIVLGGPGDDDGGEDAGAAWLLLGGSLLE